MFRLSHHARRQAESKFSPAAVLDAANRPTVTYPSLSHPNQHRHVLGEIVAVVDRDAGLVVTAYRNVVETPLRADQKERSHAA